MGAEEKEVTFYVDDRGVRVTNTRLLVPNTTYAMANITSVSTKTVRPDYTGPALLVLLGFVFSGIGFTPPVAPIGILGVLVVAAGVLWGKLLKPDFHLRISTAGGEPTALSDKDKGYVERLVQAINEAIIHRG